MKKIAIIGASGLAKEIWDLLNHINKNELQWEIIGFFDDAFEEPKEIINNTYCLGPISLLEKFDQKISVVFGIANREIVFRIYEMLSKNQYINFPNIIHPNVELGYKSNLGEGNVITSQNIFTVDVNIGDFNFFNTNCGIGHDVVIGNYNSFMPRVQISGCVTIGNYNNFYMNSSVVQNKNIGNKNTIFANSLLTKSIKDNRTYFGIPAKRINIL